MGCAASSHVSDGSDAASKLHQKHSAVKYKKAASGCHTADYRDDGAGHPVRGELPDVADEDGLVWKHEQTAPLLSTADRQEVLRIYESTFQTVMHALGTISRLKARMRQWVRAARQRIQARQAAERWDAPAGPQPPSSAGVEVVLPQQGRSSSSLAADGHEGGSRPKAAPPQQEQEQQQDQHKEAAASLPCVSCGESDLLYIQHTIHSDAPLIQFVEVSQQGNHQAAVPEGSSSRSSYKRSTASTEDRNQYVTAGEKLLSQRLEHLGLQQLHVPDDGNCLFRALSHQIFGDESKHTQVRSEVTHYMYRRRAEEYDLFFDSPEECERYINVMMQDGTFGDEMALRAACDVYGVVAHLITSEKEDYYARFVPNLAALDPTESFDVLDIFLAAVFPEHFNGVILKPKVDEQ